MSDCHTLIESKELYSGTKITLVKERYELEGKQHSMDIVRHPGAVVILPISDEGEIIFIQQYRVPLSRTIIELPAGTLEAGEDPLACAKREIIEETGFKAAHWESLGTLYPAPGFCDEIQYCFMAKELTPAYAEADSDEVITTDPKTIEDTKTLIEDGTIADTKTLSILLRASFRGFLPSLW